MIRPEDVRALLIKQPFEPFRICMSDGRAYEIRHPDMCMIGRTMVHVGVPDPKEKSMIMRVDQCALLHIVRFEPLNGTGAKQTARKRGS